MPFHYTTIFQNIIIRRHNYRKYTVPFDEMLSQMQILLLALVLSFTSDFARAKPSCPVHLTISYELRDWMEDAWLSQRIGIWHVSIGIQSMLTAASAAVLIEGGDPFVAIPSTWYYDYSDREANSTRAFAACSSRNLTNVSILTTVDRPYLSLGSLAELLGSPFYMSMRTNTIVAANELTSVTSMPKSGYAVSSGCNMLSCRFIGALLSSSNLHVQFSMARAGIGLDPATYAAVSAATTECVTLVISPNLRIPVCPLKIAGRLNEQLHVRSVYMLPGWTDVDANVVIGLDPLLENDHLVFHFDTVTNTTTVGIAWIGSRFWRSNPVRAVFYLIIALIALNWPMVPMSTMVGSAHEWYGLQGANVMSTLFMLVAGCYFVADDSVEAMTRMTDDNRGVAILIIITLFCAIVVHACIVIHAQITMPTLSNRRTHRICIFYTALICETIVLSSCGTTEYDIQALYCVAASIVWTVMVAMRVAQLPEPLDALQSISLLLAIPAMIVAVVPSARLTGINFPWTYSMITFTSCALGGVFFAIESKYRNVLAMFDVA